VQDCLFAEDLHLFSLTISDHIMIAHSLRGALSEPARGIHGNTLIVEVTFSAVALDTLNFLIDIQLAKSALRLILNAYDYTNLDEHPALTGQNTTMEFLAQHIHGLLAEACRTGSLGEAARTLSGLNVLLRESPHAWAAFEGPIG
jgi:6-pyruvoyl-tetrahydropterin synthase